MFVGHLALALAGRKATPTTSLAWLITAVCLVDLIWPIFMLAGIEHARADPGNTAFTPLAFDSYPWTHSLLMGVVWGAAFAAFAGACGVRARGAAIVGLLVVSHWLLDLVTHRPDLPVWPATGAAVYGLGLWHSIAGTFIVEGAMWVAGIAIFLRARRPAGAMGHVALWSFVIVSTFIWITGPFSPPPPNETLARFALVGWIVVPWAWWIERTSSARDIAGRRHAVVL